jgi:protoheme IX farnesyltransferase
VALTKPRLLMLVVFTSGAGLVLAPGTVTLRSGATAIALTALIVAAGTTLNMHLERDLDALMERTRERPLPAGRLRPAVALAMGILLACVSVPLLFLFVNPLTAVLGTLAFALYVGAYTPMKRRSAASVYIGAIPGATPIVMGWTAATGHLDPGALSLFAILFLWQLPHFMAISLYRKSEYAAAGIRILPLVVGERATRWHAVAAALLLTVATLVPAALGLASRPYLAVAALLALATLIGSVHVLRERAELSWARRYFLGSLVYLPVLLGTLVIGAL